MPRNIRVDRAAIIVGYDYSEVDGRLLAVRTSVVATGVDADTGEPWRDLLPLLDTSALVATIATAMEALPDDD